MNVQLGVDTLSYHCRLAAGEIGVEDVLRESADLGFAFVQVNAVHLARSRTSTLEGLHGFANDLGIDLTLSGDVIGRASRGDTPAEGAERVWAWLRTAQALGSPFIRLSSGFYRAELWREPRLIRAEQEYVTEALRLAAAQNDSGIRILLENHSDFTPDEYVSIIEAVGSESVGVFLDLINPVSVFANPAETVMLLGPLASAGHVKDFRMESQYVPDHFHRTGFAVRWCYPGEGVANLGGLLPTLLAHIGDGTFHLSIEGLDSRAGISDQRQRLSRALNVTRELLVRDQPVAP